MSETLYEHAGGDDGLHRLEELFYAKALADPVLKQLFTHPVPTHVEHLTWFTAESFGGPPRFTDQLGFGYIIDVHRHLQITDEQRERFVRGVHGGARRGRHARRRAVPPRRPRARGVRSTRCPTELSGTNGHRASSDPRSTPLGLARLSETPQLSHGHRTSAARSSGPPGRRASATNQRSPNKRAWLLVLDLGKRTGALPER